MVKYQDYDEALPVLRHWLGTQPHLPIIETAPLKTFITYCDGDLEEAKKLIDEQYTFRNTFHNMFINRDPLADVVEIISEVVDYVLLPGLTSDRNKIFIYRVKDSDINKYFFAETVRLATMYYDTLNRIQHPDKLPEALILIFDLQGYTLQHLAKVDFSAAKILTRFYQEVISIKIPHIHIINCPPYFNKIMAVVRPFLSEKALKKLIPHEKNSQTLLDHIPKELLPKELNGTCGSIEDIKKENLKLIVENRDYLMDKKYWYVDENKRPADSKKPQFNEMEGNFRTLNFD